MTMATSFDADPMDILDPPSLATQISPPTTLDDIRRYFESPKTSKFTEKTLMFSFLDVLSVEEVHKHNLALLNSMFAQFPDEVKFWNNEGKEIRNIAKMSLAEHKRKFRLHTLQLNRTTKVHRVLSRFQFAISVTTLRKNENFQNLLKQSKCRMIATSWSEAEVDEVQVAFLMKQWNPSIYSMETLTKYISQKLHENTMAEVPKFRLALSRPFMKQANKKVSTRAYMIQVQQSDLKTMEKILRTTLGKTGEVCFQRMRYANPKLYQAAICAHNQYLSLEKFINVYNCTEQFVMKLGKELTNDVPMVFGVQPLYRDIHTYRLIIPAGKYIQAKQKLREEFHVYSTTISLANQECMLPGRKPSLAIC